MKGPYVSLKIFVQSNVIPSNSINECSIETLLLPGKNDPYLGLQFHRNSFLFLVNVTYLDVVEAVGGQMALCKS